MKKLSVRDLDLNGKRVLLRVDFNVPLDDIQSITDDTRIARTLPTIEHVLDAGASVVLMSHMGRPKGKIVDTLSLKPAAEHLGELLDKDVKLAPDCVGDEVKSMASELKSGECLLLENLRFHSEEKKNDEDFAKELAGLGDTYVNDAFGTAHRAHASVVGAAEQFEKRAAGFLMEKELDYLGQAVENPKRPYVAILGGAKISDKVPVIKNLLEKIDSLIVGGAMAFTFLKSQGINVGKSFVEDGQLEIAKELWRKAGRYEMNFLLPIDFVVAAEDKDDAEVQVVQKDNIPDEMMGLDVGPLSSRIFSQAVECAKMVLWNGPMGVFERTPFRAGTEAMARTLADVTAGGGTTIIGGGDTVAAVKMAGVYEKMSHISTGGGASLEFLAGRALPGIQALSDR